jgi:hypothetical protein
MNTPFHHAPRTFVIALCLCLTALSLHSSDAQARSQRGYIKKNGTYVQPHQKTNRSARSNGGSQRDEFSNPPKYNKRRG